MKFGQKVRRLIKVNQLRLRKNSPEILVVAGAAGTVIAAVMACHATTKLPEVLDECRDRKDKLEDFKKQAEETNEVDGVEVSYDESQYRKDCVKLYANNAWDIVKLYGPSFCVEALSLSMIFASNSIHRKRTASAAAAYATLDSMFRQYRKNVVETFGEDIDHDMRYGVKHEKVEITEVDEKGKEHKKKVKVDVVDTDPENPSFISDYAKFYDESCKGWEKNAEYNLMTLKAEQSYANNMLRANGYLFLNDVYNIIGIQPTIAGQSVGWIYDPDKPSFVDFGIFNTSRANRRFVNGLEPVILLDFNVDGDLMNNPKLYKKLKKLLNNN